MTDGGYWEEVLKEILVYLNLRAASFYDLRDIGIRLEDSFFLGGEVNNDKEVVHYVLNGGEWSGMGGGRASWD
jgi:hypothetical protein